MCRAVLLKNPSLLLPCDSKSSVGAEYPCRFQGELLSVRPPVDGNPVGYGREPVGGPLSMTTIPKGEERKTKEKNS